MSAILMARAALFASIEGGSEFWSQEILKYGPVEIYEKLKADGYKEDKNSALKIASRIKGYNSESILDEITKAGGYFIIPEEVDWPSQLNDLSAIPIGLVCKGQRERLIEIENSLAIVGTRNPTTYGSRIAGDFAAGTADRGWAVISGGAIGIDTAAHKGAVIAEGVTVVVLGGGINKNYPATNEKLFQEIEESGLLISEVMPDVPALPARFLIRNRLIASLSKATIVVEAAFRSGSLRTARDAAEIFRPVMATPGPINSPTSEGCHRLIAERCAELVTSIADVFELVRPLANE